MAACCQVGHIPHRVVVPSNMFDSPHFGTSSGVSQGFKVEPLLFMLFKDVLNRVIYSKTIFFDIYIEINTTVCFQMKYH